METLARSAKEKKTGLARIAKRTGREARWLLNWIIRRLVRLRGHRQRWG